MAPDRGMAEDVPFREGPQGRRELHPTPFFLPGPNASLLSHRHSAACSPGWKDGQPSPFSSLGRHLLSLACLGKQAPWRHRLGLEFARCAVFFMSELGCLALGPWLLYIQLSMDLGTPLSSEAPLFPYPCIFSVNPGLTSHFSPKLKFPTQAHGECDSGLSGVPEPESTSSLLPSGKSTGP